MTGQERRTLAIDPDPGRECLTWSTTAGVGRPPELFCGDDGGGGPYWLVAEGLTALDAARIVWTFDSLTDGFTVAMVSGRVDGEGEDRRVTLDEDGPVDLWEVAAP